MKVAVFSDTHDHIEHTEQALDLVKERNISRILHLGDLCSPFMVPLFADIQLDVIFGNNDGDHFNILNKCSNISAVHHGEFADLTIGSKRIACYHGTHNGITESLVRSRMYDAVLSGHTHETLVERTYNTCHINPGTIHGFGKQATFAIIDIDTIGAEIVKL